MARLNDTIAYWQHKTGFASSPQTMRLMQRFGLAALGAYVAIGDAIAATPAHALPYAETDDRDALAWMLRIDPTECAELVDSMCAVGLLEADAGALRCAEVDATAAYIEESRARYKKAAAARWEKSKQ